MAQNESKKPGIDETSQKRIETTKEERVKIETTKKEQPKIETSKKKQEKIETTKKEQEKIESVTTGQRKLETSLKEEETVQIETADKKEAKNSEAAEEKEKQKPTTKKTTKRATKKETKKTTTAAEEKPKTKTTRRTKKKETENVPEVMAEAVEKVESKPEETVTKPEETTVKPEETVTKLEETAAKPEETVAKLEETVAKPEETMAKPEEDKMEETPEKTEEPEEEERKSEDLGMEKIRVLMVGSECVPFAKTGGLADVLGTLPQELNKLNVDARVMIPFHSQAKARYRMETEHITDFYVYLGWKSMFVGIDKLVLNGVTYYLIDNEEVFGTKIYKGGIPEGEQYAFFCRAVCEALDRIDFLPQVLHANDWQTGMIPMLLKLQYGHRPQCKVRTVFSIHNLMYQGQYSFAQIKAWFGIEDKYNTPEFIEHYGCASFMKAGLVFADLISTVSPTYAQEIRLPYYSYGMEGILNARAHDTWGILNGMNVEEYNPETDPYLPYHFSAADISGKWKNKDSLIQELGLHIHPFTPIISMVTRLTPQKGLNLLMPIFDQIMEEDVAIVVLGTGDKEYENFLRGMEARYKGRVCAYIGYNNEVAHRIYAGSDLFLMPSKFEPCGISQMIALRYGTLPIVRETGGLKDTVKPFNEYTGEGNGFSFTNYNSHDMLSVIKYALWTIRDEGKRTLLMQAAFAADNSFANSAKLYRDMFSSLT